MKPNKKFAEFMAANDWYNACLDGKVDEVERLIMLGTDINAQITMFGGTALHMFAQWEPSINYQDAIDKTRLLLRHQANVSCLNDYQLKPIDLIHAGRSIWNSELYFMLLNARSIIDAW